MKTTEDTKEHKCCEHCTSDQAHAPHTDACPPNEVAPHNPVCRTCYGQCWNEEMEKALLADRRASRIAFLREMEDKCNTESEAGEGHCDCLRSRLLSSLRQELAELIAETK